MIRYICFLLLVTVLFWKDAEAQDVLRFSTLNDNPPFSWTEGNIERGIDVDIVREAAKRAGYGVDFTLAPWKRLIGRITNGLDDGGMPLFYRPKREEFAIYTTVPVRMARFSMFVQKNGDETRNYNGLAEFTGQRIGQVRGLGVSEGFRQSIKINQIKHKEVTSTDQGLQLLVRKRLDGFVNDTLTTQYMIAKMNLEMKIVIMAPEVNEGEGVFLVLSKKKYGEKGAAIAEKLDEALRSMYADGTIISIIQYYLGQTQKKPRMG